jgi:cell division protein FtsL
MRKIITLVGIIVVAAIAIAWSTHDRRQTARQPAEATATMEPHDIMFTIGRRLPAESWVDPF